MIKNNFKLFAVIIILGMIVTSCALNNPFDVTKLKSDGSSGSNGSINSQVYWHILGNVGFSNGVTSYTSLALDSHDTLYAAFIDFTTGTYNNRVMKYDSISNTWVNVGSIGFGNASRYMSLAIDSSDTLYVGFRNYSDDKAKVMKFDGTNWVNVGSASFSAEATDYNSFDVDSSGTPYAAYRDSANGNRATVMKFDGTNWVNVGSAGFSAGAAKYLSIDIAPNNTPYIAYYDESISKGVVMKFNGTSWSAIGGAGFFSPTLTNYFILKIKINSNNIPYLIFIDNTASTFLTVKSYNGSSWVNVGSPGFNNGSFFALDFDSANNPYAAFAMDGKISVMKYTGAGSTGWVYVGNPKFSSSRADFLSFALDSTNNPYVLFEDWSQTYKATVMYYQY